MEKFGIFELLDALSALTARQPDASDKMPPAESTPPATDGRAAPSAAQGHSAAQPSAEKDALAAFLARHDEISRRVKK